MPLPDELTKSNGHAVGAVEDALDGSQGIPKPVIHSITVDRLRLLWGRRRLLQRWTLAGFMVSVAIALCIPNRYESTVRLMPPDQVSPSMAMLAATATGAGNSSGLGAVAGDLLGLKSTSALFVEILEGRTVADDVIDKFGLRKIYAARYMEDARSELRTNTSVTEDRRSGIITIRTTDKDPHRAAAMGAEYVDELDRLITRVNVSAAQRERMFLEGRLAQVKLDLASAEKNFSEFASTNAAIDVPEQGKAMIQAAADLEREFIASETELESLKQVYADSNVRVRAMQARANEIRQQLEKLGGKAPDPSKPPVAEADSSMYPTIRSLPILGVSYADLYRNAKLEEAIFETLTKEYELAKVEEAKETPSVKVIDAPNVAEKKMYPPRMLITLLGTCVALSIGVTGILAEAGWNERDPRDPQRLLTLDAYRTITGHLTWRPRGVFANSARKNGGSGETHRPIDGIQNQE